MRILVTGAAGFIGQHLMARLQGEGRDVVGLDDFSTSPGPTGPDVKNCDVTDQDHLDSEIMDDFDVISHLACPASPVHYQKDPIKTLETAFIGTTNVLQAAARLDRRGRKRVRG